MAYLSDVEIQRVTRILRAAGFSDQSIAWMAESCPDVQLANLYYGDGRRWMVYQDEEPK